MAQRWLRKNIIFSSLNDFLNKSNLFLVVGLVNIKLFCRITIFSLKKADLLKYEVTCDSNVILVQQEIILALDITVSKLHEQPSTKPVLNKKTIF